MKLSTRLTLFFMSISLIPLTVIGYIGFQNGIESLKLATVKRLVSVNISKEAEVRRWINASRSHLQALAQRPLVREYAVILSNGKISPVQMSAIKGKLIADHFNAGIKAGIGFVDLSLLHASDGRIMVSTHHRLENKYREHEAFFIEGKHRTFVDEVTFALTIEEMVMHVSTPVNNENGELIAVLSGHVDWTEMSNIMLQGSGLSKSEESYLINRFNYFVTHSRFTEDYPFKKSVRTRGAELCLAQQEGIDQYDDYRGVPVIGAFRLMSEYGLCLITEEDQEEAFASVVGFRNVVVGVSAAIGILVTFVSFYFARTITTRIGHLVKGAKAFSRGHFDTRIESDRKDELGLLADAFNNMAQARKKAENTIRRSRDELEVRVKERTVQITNTNVRLKKEIAERRQIEGALRKSEQEYRDLVENLDTAVVVHAADSCVVMANFRAQELLGLTERQLMGKPATDPAWHFLKEDESVMPMEDYPVSVVISTRKPLRNYIAGICNPKVDYIIWVMANAFIKFDGSQNIEQIVVTFWDITFRKAAEEKIQQSLSEKEVLLREIHHRVKNNMQMIQSLLNLQANKMANPLFKEALTDSNSRIKSMALIHETLYRSDDIGRLDLDSYFRMLVKHLYKIYFRKGKAVETVFQIEPVMLDMDASIACGLILNELVTNALKYAYNDCEDGVLEIKLMKFSDAEAELVVRDNGVGLDKDVMIEDTPSLGLKIVFMLAQDQLHGSIRIRREQGTAFQIRFPAI